MIFGSTLLAVGDEIRIYYGGSPMRHVRDDLQHAGEIVDGQRWGIFGGLARLRRDGFVSLRAGEEVGELVTQPLILSGNPITLNACTSEDGSIRVALLDEDDNIVAGDDGFRGDALASGVAIGPERLESLAGQPIRLHITCRKADLFALTL
jgi:hypothetical protein